MSQNPVTTESARKAVIDDLLLSLSTSREGLSSAEAAQRLQQYGPNEIYEKKVSSIIKFLRYFKGPIPFMIELTFFS